MKIILLIFLLLTLNIFSEEYHIDKKKKNVVKFISETPLEDFEGITDKIDGYLMGNPKNMSEKSEMYFEIQLNSIKTGIGLRDRHMRENYLHTEKYPITHFTGKITDSKKNSNGWDVNVEGDIFIHGVKKKMKSKGELIKTSEGYRIKSNFEIVLSDFKVEIPSLMFQKINENIKIELDFYLMNVSK